MRKFAQNKTYWLPSACLVSETHIRWFASSITVSKLCSDVYGTPIPVVALPRSLNLHLIIIIEQAARIYFTLPIFRIVLLRYKFWKQNLRDVIKYVMLMINFTTLLNHLLLLWRFSYYLSGRRRAELESEHFERAIPLKSCSLKARCSTKNLGEGRFRCRSKKNNANFVTSTDTKKLSAFFFNACQKNKGSLNFEQSFKIQSKGKLLHVFLERQHE